MVLGPPGTCDRNRGDRLDPWIDLWVMQTLMQESCLQKTIPFSINELRDRFLDSSATA
jgi:hypothetical protein